MVGLLLFSALLLAYANGSNDNFKGVATLYGSSTLSYRPALALATTATLAGSACALFLAQGLIGHFSGKGLVPAEVAQNPDFLLAVGTGAALTVLLATRLGFPISTTHGLVGGLLGAGLVGAGGAVAVGQLGKVFLLPLLLSPLLALLLGAALYWIAHRSRRALGLTKESCICIGQPRRYVPVPVPVAVAVAEPAPDQVTAVPMATTANLEVMVADQAECVDRYTDRVLGISLQRGLDLGHIASAATVSFARGLNDTPKIAGLLVVAQALNMSWSLFGIAVVMALGGVLHARRVAETMSHRITGMSHGQGLSANLVTGFLVLVASRMGIPVSTTHVSVGSIFGISAVSGGGDRRVIRSILMSWVITLPLAAALAATVMLLLS